MATEFKWHEAHTADDLRVFFESVLPAIRKAARELGFAIGVHGSLRRDLDLIAVPWVVGHATADALAMAIQEAACGTHATAVTWEQKACGRLATSLPICWTEDRRPSAGMIDLSVVIPNGSDVAAAKPGDRVRYVPNHAHADMNHPDCEDGVVVTVRAAITFVQFATGGPKACTPSDLVVTQSTPE